MNASIVKTLALLLMVITIIVAVLFLVGTLSYQNTAISLLVVVVFSLLIGKI